MNKKKYIFILGLGRSGTTFLANLIAQSNTPMKVVLEPIFQSNSIIERYGGRENIFCNPDNKNDINLYKKVFKSLWDSNDEIREPYKKNKIIRDDTKKEVIVIKEVHELLSFPDIICGFDSKIILIERNISRIIDSFYTGEFHKASLKYLVHENNYLRKILKSDARDRKVLKQKKRAFDYYKRRYFYKRIYKLSAQMILIISFLKNKLANDGRVYRTNHELLSTDTKNEIKKIYQFIGLDYNEIAESRITKFINGNSNGTFDVIKNSYQIVNQKFKYLSDKDVKFINNLAQDV